MMAKTRTPRPLTKRQRQHLEHAKAYALAGRGKLYVDFHAPGGLPQQYHMRPIPPHLCFTGFEMWEVTAPNGMVFQWERNVETGRATWIRIDDLETEA